MDNIETVTVKEVTKSGDWYTVSTEQSTGFGIKTKYGVVPKKGDKITLYCQGFSSIRGMDINGVKLFYKTDVELEAHRQEWLKKNEEEKQAKFLKEKDKMDAKYNALPDFFKKRIDRFRSNNPRFRVDYEGYEMFCCEQAVVIAKACKTKEKVQEFQSLESWKKQRKMVKKLDSGHSGNTFGASCALAYLYLSENPENVVKMHGTLSPLVGSDAFGDTPKSL